MKYLQYLMFGLFLSSQINLAGQEMPRAAFKYQAVARDGSGNVLRNQNLRVQVSIIAADSNNVLLTEEHSTTTSGLGIFTLEVGRGSGTTGSIGEINWGASEHLLQVGIDVNGGNNFVTIQPSSKILGVPFAAHALTAANVEGDDDPDPLNEIQSLIVDGDQIFLSGDTSATVVDLGDIINNSLTHSDQDSTNELQQLTLEGTTLTLSKNGGSVNLPSGSMGDGDSDPNNEIQVLTRTGNDVTLSVGGGTINIEDDDTDPTNELQSLVLDGDEISISGDATNTVIDLGEIINNTVVIDPEDPTNELQNLTRTGDNVTLSNGGGTVDIKDDDSDATNEIQTLTRLGDDITLSNGGGSANIEDGDADPNNEIQQLTINGSVLSLSDGGGSVNLPEMSGDADADPQNEIQTLSRSGDDIMLSLGGGTVNVADDDADATNELQTVSKSGEMVTLSDGGGKFNVRDDDADPSNEIQTLSLVGSTLALSDGGNSVEIPISPWTESGSQLSYAGAVILDGTNGNSNVEMGGFFGSNEGFIALGNSGGATRVLGAVSNGAGTLFTSGPNGSTNTSISVSSQNANLGEICIYDASGSKGPCLDFAIIDGAHGGRPEGVGSITSDVKMCRMDHPTQPTKEIWYTALEGSGVDAFTRGQVQLVAGTASVKLPDHFLAMATSEGMTITLTPHSAKSLGLAAIDRTATGFTIKELGKGTGSYLVDWEVKSARKGFEQVEAVREKKQ